MKMWERKGIRPRQPHRRSNRNGMKIDSGIRIGEKYLKGHPGFGPSLSPHQSYLFLLGMSLSDFPSLQWREQDKCS